MRQLANVELKNRSGQDPRELVSSRDSWAVAPQHTEGEVG